MGNFNRSFNRDGRGGGGFNRRGSGGDREMFKTTCSNCGRECEVPFKPNGSKPVFCSDCFERNGGEQRRSNDRDFAKGRSNFQDRRVEFSQNRNYERPQNNDQLASLNAKLDQIINLLTPKPTTPLKEQAPIIDKKSKTSRKPKTAPVEVVE